MNGAVNTVGGNDRHYQFTDADDIIVTIDPLGDITGNGLNVQSTTTGAAIIVDHQGEISVDAGNWATAGGFGVFRLTTNGGNITYTGNGSVIDNVGLNDGLAINTGFGAGDISIGTAVNGVVPTYQGQQALRTNSGTGNQAIFLNGGTITTVGDPLSGNAIRMFSSSGNLNLTLQGGTQLINADGAPRSNWGINADSGTGNVTIVSDAIIGTDTDRFSGGMRVETQGVINITQSGNIFGNTSGITVVAGGNTGNAVNVINSGNIDSLGGGIDVIAGGSNRNVTVTNTPTGSIHATGGAGVRISGGNIATVNNDFSSNSIIGNPNGVEIQFAAVANVSNTFGGSITGLTGNGVFIDTIAGNANINNSFGGQIFGGVGGVGGTNGIRVTNVGGTTTINNSLGGVVLGTVDGIQGTNLGPVVINNSLGGSITGNTGDGIDLTNAGNVTIDNGLGTITATAGDGINLNNVGAVDIDNRDGAITGGEGIEIDVAGDVTIDNRLGEITGTAGAGINLNTVGVVGINNRDGTITGGTQGVLVNTAGNVTIDNRLGLIQGNTFGTLLTQVGNVAIDNGDGDILGGAVGVAVTNGGTVTLDNTDGNIAGGTNGVQMQFAGNVAIDNSAGGTIEGTGGDGIIVVGSGNVTIDNRLGDITGGNDAIRLNNVGVVGIDNRDGTITGGDDGIDITNAGNVTIDNRFAGSITGGDDGIFLGGAGGVNTVNILNQFGTITGTNGDGVEANGATSVVINNEDGTITGGNSGVVLANVTNNVTIDNDDGTITGQGDEGIAMNGVGGSVEIFNRTGTITGFRDGIDIDAVTGTVLVDNRTGGSIEGQNGDGIDVNGAAGVTVLNHGDIGAPGTILGGDDGVVLAGIGAGGVVINNSIDGSIIGTNGDGVQVSNSASANVFINNTSGGLIHGQGGDGINIDDVQGVTIWNQTASDGGTTIGAFNGISMSNVGAGGVNINNQHGIIRGEDGHGIIITDSGLAFVTIDNRNDGLIEGLDGATNSGGEGIHVSEVTAGSGGAFGVHILNNADGGNPGGTIFGHQSGIHLADIGAGGVLIENEGGTITGDTGDGVHIGGSAGAVVVDNEGGTITGANSGVVVLNADDGVTINNDGGTITGDGDEGIEIANIVGNVDISNQNGTIIGFWDGIDIDSVDGSVMIDNTLGGTITGQNADGVDVSNVTNDITVNNDGGTITGGGDEGVAIANVGGNVVIANLNGTILGVWDGIDIDNVAGTALVDNRDGGSIEGQGGDGIDVNGALGVTVLNQGDIGPAGTILGNDDGVVLANVGVGGVFINNSFSGSITGTNGDGVQVSGSAGLVFVDNSDGGTITGGDDGVEVLNAGGDVTIDNDDGTITGQTRDGIAMNTVGGNVEIFNRNGTIIGFLDGIDLDAVTGTVLVDNRDGGSITGQTDDGIDVSGALGVTVLNQGVLLMPAGTILGNDEGVHVANIGTSGVFVDNRFGGSIIGTTDDGVDVDGSAGDVTVDNRSGGFISGGDDGVDIDDVTGNVLVDNRFGGTIIGGDEGVEIETVTGNVTVDNRSSGSITGGNDGVQIEEVLGNVVVANGGSGLISGAGGDGVDVEDVTGNVTVNNVDFATITGADSGVEIDEVTGNVAVNNTAFADIIGGDDGVLIFDVIGNVTVNNTGFATITGNTGDGVDIEDIVGDISVNNSGSAAITGADSGVEIDLVTGNVAINNSGEASIFGGDDGIEIDVVDGDITISNTGSGTITGGAGDGIDIDDVSGHVLVENLDDGHIVGAESGIQISSAGSVEIQNEGLIQGEGSAANPVIGIMDSGDVDIVNHDDGVIGSASLLEDYAGSLADLAVFRAFTDFFGGGGMLPDADVDAALAQLPGYFTAGGDVAMDVESDGEINVNNEGLLVGRGVFETDGAGTFFLNADNGVWLTSGVNQFVGSPDDVVENHGLVQTALDPATVETTTFDGLDLFENHGVLSMMDDGEGDRTEISGTFAAGSGWLAVDTFFGPPGVGESDVLAIGGNMNGSTAVVINKTNALPGGLNEEGITVVEIGGATENDCFGVLCQVGDAGFISEQSEDFFAFAGHNFVHDNGLFLWGMTQRDDPANGSELVLVSDIGPHAAQLPTLITAAQNVWYESTSVVEDHIYGLRYGATPGLAPLADLPIDEGRYTKGGSVVAPPVAAPQPRSSAAWLKVYGSRTDQDTSVKRNFDGTATELEFDTGFEQDTLGVMGGLDFGNKIAPDVMFRFGVFGGYTRSDVDYDTLGSDADLRGPLVGGYVSYSSGGFYVDAMGRADFLDMDFDSPTIPGGFDGADEDVTSIGVLANVGYRHEMGNAFIEPIGSFAYVNSDVGSFEVSGSKVSFSGDESMRLGGGGRIGGTLMTGPDHALEASVLGKVWHEFEDNTVTITDPFGAHTEVSDDAKDTFGELTGSLTAYGLDRSWSVFVSGGAKFNSDFVTYGGKGGVRYAF